MDEQLFVESLSKLGIVLSFKQKQQFREYKDFLVSYNKRVNLTAITTTNEIYSKHFYDSMLVGSDIKVVGSVIDVGSGGGFPGVPLKIVYPNISLTLLEPTKKKAYFLEQLVDLLGLDGVVASERAEDYALKHLDEYDIVLARAVANLTVLVELCLPLVKIGGCFGALKGLSGLEELQQAQSLIKLLGGGLIKTFEHDYDQQKRVNIYIPKLSKTPKGYPRTFAQIKKAN